MRRQVVVLVTATTLLVLVAFLLPLTVLLSTLARDRAVGDATREAQSLAALVGVSAPAQLPDALAVVDQRSDREVGVRLPDGTVLGHADRGSEKAQALAGAGRSFSASVGGGEEVYVPVDTGDGRAVVWDWVPGSLLRRGVRPAVGVSVGLGAGLLVLTVALADRLARGTVRPMRSLAATALALGDGQLSARAAVGGPEEVREVAHALNVLAQRIDELLVAEREAVADLSHRLRTPLTALRLDVDAVTDPALRSRLTDSVEGVQTGIDRVIAEARRQVREGVVVSCDVTAAVRTRTGFWSVLMEDQNRPFTVTLPEHAVLARVGLDELGAVIDTLLQNALVHTPDGTAVSVAVSALAPGGAAVVVADRGPGLPPGAEVRGRSSAGSSGLGLDIARRTCEASGGRLVLHNDGGAVVRLELGPPL